MSISRRTVNRITFWVLIGLGIALAVASIFYPALIAAGVACIGAATAIREGTEAENGQERQADPQAQGAQQPIAMDFGHHNVLILSEMPQTEYHLPNQKHEQDKSCHEEEERTTVHLPLTP